MDKLASLGDKLGKKSGRCSCEEEEGREVVQECYGEIEERGK